MNEPAYLSLICVACGNGFEMFVPEAKQGQPFTCPKCGEQSGFSVDIDVKRGY